MAETKNSESFSFLFVVGVAVTVVGGIIVALILSDTFRDFVGSIGHGLSTAAVWFFTAWVNVPVCVATFLAIVCVGSTIGAVSTANRKAELESEEYKTSYLRYTKDEFEGVTWTWAYVGRQIVSLYPICSRDGTPMVFHTARVEQEDYSIRPYTFLRCETCPNSTNRIEGDTVFFQEKIERQILRKINSNEYLKVIKKQKSPPSE